MYSLLQDFRFAFRQLMKTPGFALTAIASLALGIGATTAVFSVVYAVLMDPYPYANVNRMAHLAAKDKSDEGTYLGLTGPQLQQVRELPMIEDLIAYTGWNLTITGHDLPEDVNGTYFTSNAFNFFGVPAYLGRGLLPSDAIDGQDPQAVVVLGYKFWQRHFNADPTVLGRTIQLVHKNYVIVGVAAPRFAWNDGDVYLPLKITASDPLSYSTSMRLKPGISHEAVNAALEPLIQQYAHDIPSHFPQHFKVQVRGFNDGFVHDLGGTLALLFTAVALLLAIGCGNVSILLLARGAARQHEFAVRSAIGAGRARIIRQLLTESLLLSLTGAALGVALAYKTVAFIVALLPESSFPHEAAIQINLPVLLFSVGVALLTGILFGLGPAFQISSPEVSQVMQSTRRIAGGVTGRRIFNLLIGGQIALTLLMLAGAGTAAESFFRLIHTNLGYEPHNIMSVGIPIHENTYKTWAERSTYFEQLRAKAAQVSGVTMTAISSNATPPSNGFKSPLEILGQPASDQHEALLNLVSPEYFPALRIPLLQGRIWDATENRNAAHLVVINQTMARQFFPNGDAVGHSLKVPVPPAEPPFRLIAPGIQDSWLQIVGVVADDLDDGLDKPIKPELFLPFTDVMGMYTQILVRSNVPPLTLLHQVRAQVSSIDPDQQVNGRVHDLEQWIADEPEWARGHLVAWLFGAFAILALALAAVGLYSVVSYSVVQRTNEFGIRMALGASRSHVLKIVFDSTMMSVGSGVLAGIILIFASGKLLARWAEGSSRDPLMLLAVICLLCLAAVTACVVPARRAAEVDPMTAIRDD